MRRTGEASSGAPPCEPSPRGGEGGLGLRFSLWLQDDDLGLVLSRRGLDAQLGLGFAGRQAHLLEEAVDGVELQLQPGDGVVHGYDIARLELPYDLGRLGRVDGRVPAHGYEQDVS